MSDDVSFENAELFQLGLIKAEAQHRALEKTIIRRSSAEGGVLAPTLKQYEAWLAAYPEKPLENLTAHLLAARDETRNQIRARMQAKWDEKGGTPSDVEKSVTNSLRRSAGTNFQALVSLAISTAFRDHNSAWYVSHPVPRAFGESLAIRFVGGAEGNDDDETFRVIPDLDILIRNASWRSENHRREPILLLSVKTSIADRGGMAARWKNYFDLVTKPCPYRDDPKCAWMKLGISLEQELHYEITQGIVVANIYKIESDKSFTERGELHSGQARANTYMFDLKLTTRTDDPAAVPVGWDPLEKVLEWASETSERYELPRLKLFREVATIYPGWMLLRRYSWSPLSTPWVLDQGPVTQGFLIRYQFVVERYRQRNKLARYGE